MDKNLEIIKSIILDYAKKYNIEIYKIILFGSRARGDYREDSDYDILVITKKKLDWKTINNFYADVIWEITNKNIYSDLIIISKDEFEKYKEYRGFVYYWAAKEGILLE